MIESKTKEKEENVEDYPIIKCNPSNKEIVLFCGEECGTLVGYMYDNSNFSENEIGDYSEDWDERSFNKYDGSVTLKNK